MNNPVAMRYGGFWLRVVAALIDGIIAGIINFIIMIGVGFALSASGASTNAVGAIANLFSLGILWIYSAGFESSNSQATPGKMVMGLVVTDHNGQRVSFARATGRHFGKILSGLIIGIGFLMVAFTEKKQGLHDILAGTLVIKK